MGFAPRRRGLEEGKDEMSKRSVPAVHVCRFVAEFDPKTPKPKRGVKCSLCPGTLKQRKQATAYVLYPSGADALCAAHLKEETGKK